MKTYQSPRSDLKYDLKGPCNECPFSIKAPWHEGITKDLLKFHSHAERGTLVFTCHKTDPRADSPIGKAYKGKPQHCGGLLAMMSADVSQLGISQKEAFLDGRWDPCKMKKKPKVFKDFYQMMKHYLALTKIHKKF